MTRLEDKNFLIFPEKFHEIYADKAEKIHISVVASIR